LLLIPLILLGERVAAQLANLCLKQIDALL
jgi:hypothetical protein